jgi:6-pyruvoyl-tetrahydropterin synthase
MEKYPKSTSQYSIKLSKEDFKFNCAHFLCEENDREYLHGHNY